MRTQDLFAFHLVSDTLLLSLGSSPRQNVKHWWGCCTSKPDLSSRAQCDQIASIIVKILVTPKAAAFVQQTSLWS